MNKKLKLYIYPHARKHTHDQEEIYKNTVPLSAAGIKQHCELVSPEEADYFYMGQISDGVATPPKESFSYIEGKEEKHICDIEGDWLARTLPEWLEDCTLTMNGVRKEYVDKKIKIFTRPTFTFLLMDIVRNNKNIKYNFNDNKKFGFKGFPDPLGVRRKMLQACEMSNGTIDYDVKFNNKWEARAAPNSKIVVDYCKGILSNTFSLCPRGTGVDTVRFFESCFLSRIPVVISDCRVFGHEYHLSNPFYFQIDPNISASEMMEKLIQIQDTSIEKLKDMSYNSKQYFETCIREYFEDPTLRFIEWLEGENE